MKRLGELEATVMDLMWSTEEPVTVRELLERIDRSPPLAYTTVMTVMDNLHRKHFLLREKDGRAYRYRAVKSRSEHTAELMRELLAGSGDRTATMLRFIGSMPPSEAARIQSLLQARTGDESGRP